MNPEVRLADVRETPLSIDEVMAAVHDPAVGGVVLFVGTVREQDGGRGVEGLGYSAHTTAVRELRAVAERIASEEDVVALAAVHRVGDLAVGDVAVVVAAAAAHRPAAFTAARRLIDELKAEVPVWKNQLFTDGGSEWVHHA